MSSVGVSAVGGVGVVVGALLSTFGVVSVSATLTVVGLRSGDVVVGAFCVGVMSVSTVGGACAAEIAISSSILAILAFVFFCSSSNRLYASKTFCVSVVVACCNVTGPLPLRVSRKVAFVGKPLRGAPGCS